MSLPRRPGSEAVITGDQRIAVLCWSYYQYVKVQLALISDLGSKPPCVCVMWMKDRPFSSLFDAGVSMLCCSLTGIVEYVLRFIVRHCGRYWQGAAGPAELFFGEVVVSRERMVGCRCFVGLIRSG